MKKIFLLLIVCSINLSAQWSSASVRLGYFVPGATSGGFIIGYEGEHFFDERVSFGWSIDWFHKNYVDENLANSFNQYYGGVGGTINELRAKTNLHDLPIMIHLSVNFPVAPKTKAFLTGGVGAEALLINYSNFENPDQSEFKAAFDFNWRIGAGALYEIGSRSDILLELDYHSSNPSWQFDVTDPNTGIKRTFERSFDMSGIILRAGIRFFF